MVVVKTAVTSYIWPVTSSAITAQISSRYTGIPIFMTSAIQGVYTHVLQYTMTFSPSWKKSTKCPFLFCMCVSLFCMLEFVCQCSPFLCDFFNSIKFGIRKIMCRQKQRPLKAGRATAAEISNFSRDFCSLTRHCFAASWWSMLFWRHVSTESSLKSVYSCFSTAC